MIENDANVSFIPGHSPQFSIVSKSSSTNRVNQFRTNVSLYFNNFPEATFFKIDVLKNFAIFTGKDLWQSLFFKSFIKKENLRHEFSCEFCKIFKKAFFYTKPPVSASAFQYSAKNAPKCKHRNIWKQYSMKMGKTN